MPFKLGGIVEVDKSKCGEWWDDKDQYPGHQEGYNGLQGFVVQMSRSDERPQKERGVIGKALYKVWFPEAKAPLTRLNKFSIFCLEPLETDDPGLIAIGNELAAIRAEIGADGSLTDAEFDRVRDERVKILEDALRAEQEAEAVDRPIVMPRNIRLKVIRQAKKRATAPAAGGRRRKTRRKTRARKTRRR